MKNSKKSIIIGVTSLFLIMLVLLGLTYAYYRTRIIGNESPNPSISVQSKKLEITYMDGNSSVNMEGKIEPGFKFEKTFSVENTGDGEVNYGVYLEDVINEFTRISDIKLMLTCESDVPNKTCNGATLDFPKIDALLSTNILNIGETQTYKMVVEYLNLNEDQSIDMGLNLSAKIQIYDLNSSLNENTLAYKIIHNSMTNTVGTTYKSVPLSIPGQEVTTLQKSVEGSNKTISLVDGSYYTYAKEMIFSDTSGYTLINPQVDTWANIKANPNKLANFKYLRRESGKQQSDAMDQNGNPIERTQTLRDIIKVNNISDNTMTYSALDITGSTESKEQTLSATLDNYGITFYYRGNVMDNYLSYNGMCWRIVRVLGDGSIKIILENSDNVCESSTGKNFIIQTASFGADEVNGKYISNYKNPSYNSDTAMRNVLNNWLSSNNFDTNDLRSGDWCLGNMENFYSDNAPYNKIEGKPSDLISNSSSGTKYNYASYANSYRKYPETTSLICNGEIVNDYVGALTVDEVLYAGGKLGLKMESVYLLESNQYAYWNTMTTLFYQNFTDKIGYVAYNAIDYVPVNNSSDKSNARPSIILKAGTVATWNENISEYGAVGSKTNPYKVD